MRTRLELVSLLLFVTPAVAHGQSLSSAYIGTWHLNVAKSNLHAPAIKEETVTIQNSTTDTLVAKYTITGTDGAGKPINSSFDGKADGKPYPSMSNGQETAKVTWSRTGSRQLTAQAAYPDGSTSTSVLEMAKDGRS